MPISSVIVRKTESMSGRDLADRIAAVDGATLEHQDVRHFVVVIEASSATEERGVWDALEALDGVVGVDLVYHNYEDACDE